MKLSNRIMAVVSLALLLQSPAYSQVKLHAEQFARVNSSDPDLVSDNPKSVQKLRSDLARAANSLQNSLFMLSTKHNHFLGQPLISKIEKDALNLPDAHLFDYYLLSLQFNVPAMKKVPLNKYRYLRFETLLSIAPESFYVGRTDVMNASTMLRHLEEPLARPLDNNYGINQRKEYCLEWLEKVDLDTTVLSEARWKCEDTCTDDAIKSQIAELCALISAAETKLTKANSEPELTSALNESSKPIKDKLKNLLADFDEAIPKPKGELATIRESLSDDLIRGTYLAALVGKPVNNPWDLQQRSQALSKGLLLGADGAKKICLASNLDPSFREIAALLSKELCDKEKTLPLTAHTDLSSIAKSFADRLESLDGKILENIQKGQVRKEAIFGNYKSLDKHRASATPRNFRIISIYPTNEILKVDFENKQTYEVKVEPKWMEMASGHASWNSVDTTKYMYDLPRVAGIASQYGTVSWTFYPAKRQPVMYGNKNTFAILQVARGTQGALRVNSCLNYELSLTPPLLGAKLYDEASINLDQRMPIGTLLSLRAADLGVDAISKVFQSTLIAQKVSPSLKLNATPKHKPFIETGNKIYRVDDDQMVKFKLDKNGDVEATTSKF